MVRLCPLKGRLTPEILASCRAQVHSNTGSCDNGHERYLEQLGPQKDLIKDQDETKGGPTA